MKPKNRKTTTPIKVCVLPEERAFIQEQAKLCCRTTSTYLRDLALGYKPQSKTDLDVVREMMFVNKNLYRLGNLLKLWLDDDQKAQGFNHEQIQSLLNVLTETAQTLRNKADKILKKHRDKSSLNP
ncbi:MAG: conjugal transfer protein TraJ [Acetobacter sp.]|nr:conjugal transfer protein TraJ [Acetobacter sp.]